MEGELGLCPFSKGEVFARVLLLLAVEVEVLGILAQASIAFLESKHKIIPAGKAPADGFPVTEGHVVQAALGA